MTVWNSMWHILNASLAKRVEQMIVGIFAWSIGSCIAAELLGYWLHRLLHSGLIRFLSCNHMKHHMVFYGPLQKQRTHGYLDATEGSLSLGNIGLEWLIPTVLVIGIALALFHHFHVGFVYQLLFLGITVTWSFLMFSYLHDLMHVDGVWVERSKWLGHWFVTARRLHDIHHHLINGQGLMDKNFGIGFFIFDRLFGTFSPTGTTFNFVGYERARHKWSSLFMQRFESETTPSNSRPD